MPRYTISVVEGWRYKVEADNEAEARWEVERYGGNTNASSRIKQTELAHTEIIEVTEENNADIQSQSAE